MIPFASLYDQNQHHCHNPDLEQTLHELSPTLLLESSFPQFRELKCLANSYTQLK